MSSIAEVSSKHVQRFWHRMDENLPSASLESASRWLTQAMCSEFSNDVVLTRVFATLPFRHLSDDLQAFALRRASSAGVDRERIANKPVLTLFGTWGKERSWRERGASRNFQAIPLVSSQFIDSVPMMSRLMQEMGLGLDWIDETGESVSTQNLARLAGTFHVEDARHALDARGRHIIGARDFVSAHGVRTVFGLGGTYLNGMILVVIVFTNCRFDKRHAALFMPVINHFKSRTMEAVMAGKLFDSSA